MKNRLFTKEGFWSETATTIAYDIENAIKEVIANYKLVLDDTDLTDIRLVILSSASNVELSYALDKQAQAWDTLNKND